MKRQFRMRSNESGRKFIKNWCQTVTSVIFLLHSVLVKIFAPTDRHRCVLCLYIQNVKLCTKSNTKCSQLRQLRVTLLFMSDDFLLNSDITTYKLSLYITLPCILSYIMWSDKAFLLWLPSFWVTNVSVISKTADIAQHTSHQPHQPAYTHTNPSTANLILIISTLQAAN